MGFTAERVPITRKALSPPSFCSQRMSGEKVRKSGEETEKEKLPSSTLLLSRAKFKDFFPRLRLCHNSVPLTSPLLGITLLDTSIHLFLPLFLPPSANSDHF